VTPPPLEYKAIALQWLLGKGDGLDCGSHRTKAFAFVRIQEVVG